MSIDRIVVTGDILRPNGRGTSNPQEQNLRWLAGLLGPFLQEATGLPVRVVDAAAVAGSFQRLHADAGLTPGLDEWAAIYEEVPAQIGEMFAEACAGSLVIGFELPPGLTTVLHDRGIPCVDVVIHPVRYLRDLILGLTSNRAEVRARLAAQALGEAQARVGTAPMRAFAARRGVVPLPEDTVLFVGQASIDRSMISGGRFLRPADYVDRLVACAEAAAAHGTLAVKPHPLDRNETLLAALRRSRFRLVEPGASIYALLASGRIAHTISLSSSVGEESRFFGVPATYGLALSTPVTYRESPVDMPGHVSIADAYLSADFWRDCLAPVLPVTPADGLAPLAEANLLRRTLGVYWGYEAFAFDAERRAAPDWAGTRGAGRSLRALARLEGLAERGIAGLRRTVAGLRPR